MASKIKVNTGVWKNATFSSLSTGCKLVYMYLITNSDTNLIGCYYMPPEQVASGIGCSVDLVKDCYTILQNEGVIEVCQMTGFVLLVGYTKLHPVNSVATGKRALVSYNDVPAGFSHHGMLAQEMMEPSKHFPEKSKRPVAKPARQFQLPEWIDKKLWLDWLEIRKELKKPVTEGVARANVKKLERLRVSGEDIDEVMEQTIANSWQSFFPVKKDQRDPRDGGQGGQKMPSIN